MRSAKAYTSVIIGHLAAVPPMTAQPMITIGYLKAADGGIRLAGKRVP
jgi:hypothetical protein